ncbi:MAG: Chromate transporter, chromate ion transporter family [Acidimicrobiaceae bacterium]|nr:Chromate transporter, chromate ion transporter family [Acidimicrobiaceae bacterium]
MTPTVSADEHRGRPQVALWTIVGQWTRLGCIGFGGPPTHIALLRRMCVEERKWIEASEFEDGIAATNLLPGPASTQLAIFCAWRLRGPIGAILGGICFIVPGLVIILLLSAVFLARHPSEWILGAAAGAGAAVPAVALNAASGFVPASWKRIGTAQSEHARWVAYALLGGAAAATIGPYLVLVLVGCGLAEIAVRREGNRPPSGPARIVLGAVAGHAVALGGFAALAWVALKVGALSYGGGFVIVPLMQHDAVTTYHWMTGAQFLNAVALGQVTPGPVVLTTAVVGYAAKGIRGGLFAALIAFTPSFLFVLVGGPRFDRIRANAVIQSFLTGAGPAVIGAIAGSALPLGLAFQHLWQVPVLAGALLWLFVVHRGVVSSLLIAGAVGVVLAVIGVPV